MKILVIIAVILAVLIVGAMLLWIFLEERTR